MMRSPSEAPAPGSCRLHFRHHCFCVVTCNVISSASAGLSLRRNLSKTVELDIRFDKERTGAPMFFVTTSSYRSGFITEFIGRITIENMLYQGVASITSKEWRMHIKMKGTQHRKSVVMMMAIL